MKKILAITVAFFLLLAPLAAFAEWYNTVVHLTDLDGANLGSGVIVKMESKNDQWTTYILTSYHVGYETKTIDPVKGIVQVERRTLFVDGHKVDEVTKSQTVDVLLLKMVTKTHPPYSTAIISRTDVKVLDQVFAVGYPSGIGPVITNGYVSSIHPGTSPTGQEFLHSADISYGSSGGGIFRDGKLVGLTRAVGMSGPDGVTLFFVAFGVRITLITNAIKQSGYQNLLDFGQPK